jgi:Leucine-rich repeat (LRR) protein
MLSLKGLFVSHNCISALPENIGALCTLHGLYIDDNRLSELPESLYDLSELRCLHIHNNRIRLLPESIGKLTKMVKLEFNGNPLPRELLALTGKGMIFKFARQAFIKKYFAIALGCMAPVVEALLIHGI